MIRFPARDLECAAEGVAPAREMVEEVAVGVQVEAARVVCRVLLRRLLLWVIMSTVAAVEEAEVAGTAWS